MGSAGVTAAPSSPYLTLPPDVTKVTKMMIIPYTPSSLQLTKVAVEKRPLNGCFIAVTIYKQVVVMSVKWS